jgi:lipoprotein-anchoring transpeptidase ErfK/SrfK
MYWYYKYPLIILLTLLGAGVLWVVWRSLPDSFAQTVAKPFEKAKAALHRPASGPPKTVSAPLKTTPVAPPAAPARPATPLPAPTAPPVATPTPPPVVPPSPPAPPVATPVAPPAAVGSSPSPAAPADGSDAVRFIEAARKQVEGYNYMAARQLAARVFTLPGVTEFDQSWNAAAEMVSRINTVFMTSETASPERKAYTVQPGDSLSRIAGRLSTTVGALQRLNGLDLTNPVIYPGNVLYTLNVEWGIRVVKSKFVLLLLNGKDLYRLYHVGVGRENKTPVGTFVISTKVVHPAWTRAGRGVPFGNPDNPLGTHWLGLTPSAGTETTLSGYGIHGTWEPDSIGGAASEGCVRMLNDQIRELFDFLPEPGRGQAVPVVIED